MITPPNKAPLLLTGFEPFGGFDANPSAEVAAALDGTRVADVDIVAARLPVSYRDAPAVLQTLLSQRQWSAVCCLGLWGEGQGLRLETLGRNLITATVDDNHGECRLGQPVLQDGPAMLPVTLPVATIAAAWRSQGLSFQLSDDAGGYLCNLALYHLLLSVEAKIPAGFIHLPPLPGQTPLAGMALAMQIEAVRIALTVTMAHQNRLN